MTKTCFVVMPIGTQTYDGKTIPQDELRKRYDDLIKEALEEAIPFVEVTRADDVALSGTITTDILTRIMHSDFVVADVSFPNPNVFYELGLRHACRPGTIIIRDADAAKPPFDISHLRHIEYQNTPSGLKKLKEDFAKYFKQYSQNPERPDSHFLELAKLTEYRFPSYESKKAESPEVELMMALMSTPALLALFTSGKQPSPEEIIAACAQNPDAAKQLFGVMAKTGQLNFTKPKPSGRRHRG